MVTQRAGPLPRLSARKSPKLGEKEKIPSQPTGAVAGSGLALPSTCT
jgi:hypothetical protein